MEEKLPVFAEEIKISAFIKCSKTKGFSEDFQKKPKSKKTGRMQAGFNWVSLKISKNASANIFVVKRQKADCGSDAANGEKREFLAIPVCI